jgi:hypothetical protein
MRTSAASLAAGRLGVPNPDSNPAKNGTLRRPKRGAEKGTQDFLNSLGGFWYKQRVSKTSVYETPANCLEGFFSEICIGDPANPIKLGLG